MVLDENGRPMVVVKECQGEGEAEVVASYLRACGLHVRLNCEIPKSLLPVEINRLGRMEVLVREADVTAAQELLSDPAPAED